MPKKNRQTRKRKGGKLLDSGSFGCAYSPSIRCSTTTKKHPSSNKQITKYINSNEAEREIDAGLIIEEAFENAHIPVDPSTIILYPKVQCNVPTNLTANEIAENPLGNCPVEIKTPKLIQMAHGGQSLFRFQCPPTDVAPFLKSILQLTKNLQTFHDAGLAHLDIKSGNIVTQKVGDVYETRFIDVGFIQNLHTYDINKPFTAYLNDYLIWPFEIKFLALSLLRIDLTYHARPLHLMIQQHMKMVETTFPHYALPTSIYIQNGKSVFLDETQTTYSPLFNKNMKYLTAIYHKEKNEQDVIKEVGKLTDVYSFATVLYDIFIRISNLVLTQAGKITYLRPIASEKEKALYTEIYVHVATPFFNLIYAMLNPDITERLKDLSQIHAILTPLFTQLSAIYAKHTM